MTAPHEGGADRVLTLPNAITTVRLLCIPLFVVLLANGERLAAACLLGALGATDWVDGQVARRLHQVSTVGKILDPTADRLLLGVGVVAIMVDGSVPLWIGILVLVREVVVAGAALALAAGGARRIDVQWVGKAGTLCLMFAFPLFLASHAGLGSGWDGAARAAAWLFVVAGLAFSYYAAVTYIPLARQAWHEGRAGRAAPGTVAAPAEPSA